MTFLYNFFYKNLPVERIKGDGMIHLLNEEERKHIKKTTVLVIVVSMVFSVIGFLLYYLPTYYLTQFFPLVTIKIPFTDINFPFALYETIWGIILMIIEIYLLVLLNIYGVHETAVATGFLNEENKTTNHRAKETLNIALEARNKDLEKYGINPFQGVKKWQLFLFNLFFRLKGWLGNTFLRFALRRLFGRFAVRALLDFGGMPIYMTINALAANAVLRSARVVIMGKYLIQQHLKKAKELIFEEEDKILLYDTLQYIAMSKRDYHANHYALTKGLLESLDIPKKQEHILSENYLEKLSNAPTELKEFCTEIILTGFILDGSLSWREKRKLESLQEHNLTNITFEELKKREINFIQGIP